MRRPTDSDLDHAEWLNGPEVLVYEPAHPCGRELTTAEMTAELRRVLGPVLDRIRNIEQSAHRCRHGIDEERATCGTCMHADEDMGTAQAARFDKGSQ